METHTLIGNETKKAMEYFPLSGYAIDTELIRALAMVKLSACNTNASLSYLSLHIAEAIALSAKEIIELLHHEQMVVDPLQGGAGTSYNMNINEVLAALANQKLCDAGGKPEVDALNHVNLHQSTNDVFPTAVRIAILNRLKALEGSIAILQESLQDKEKEFSDVVKVGRTELQDAVPMALGMEFGAYAEAISRDRWRIFKSRERIKTLNLGGTALGTGLGAPREYIFRVVDELKRISGLSISRAENLVDYTQNLDSFVEVSAMTKALAVNLLKIANDLKLLSSGPDCGFGEINLPMLQKGSSIMPGKVNPVMPEAICQVALKVISDDNLISLAAGLGQLELNQYLPLIAHTFLENLRILTNACKAFAHNCIMGVTANRKHCLNSLQNSRSVATYLIPLYGYEKVERLVQDATAQKISIRDVVLQQNLLTTEQFDELMSPRRMYKLGFSSQDYSFEVTN